MEQITAYFDRIQEQTASRWEHPRVTQEFRTGQGWQTIKMRKRISPTWFRKLRKAGVTAVAVTAYGRTADFTIREACRG